MWSEIFAQSSNIAGVAFPRLFFFLAWFQLKNALLSSAGCSASKLMSGALMGKIEHGIHITGPEQVSRGRRKTRFCRHNGVRQQKERRRRLFMWHSKPDVDTIILIPTVTSKYRQKDTHNRTRNCFFARRSAWAVEKRFSLMDGYNN